MQAKRLWDKGEAVDARMQVLTVGDDPEIDRRLITHDAIGSAAHARMLSAQGLLSGDHLAQLLKGLRTIYTEAKAGEFVIPFELEDVHTAIESRLTEEAGETGKRIHAARSRNDQVCLAVRLFMRDELVKALEYIGQVLTTLESRFYELKDQPMPGYTHLQPAMPSSVGLWLHSYYEALLEFVFDGVALFDSINICPLGSGAGFGTNLPIDRQKVAKILGFRDIQRSVIDVNNGRGRFEEKVLHWAAMVAGICEKWACDLTLFCTEEFGFISLPKELTTGSSIMPQKRNPDLAELLRARPSKVRASLAELVGVTAKLPSSYHRDLQYTKFPLVRGLEEFFACLEMFHLSLKGFQLNEARLKEAMYPELYATYYANRLVQSGKSFRDAYRETAELVEKGQINKEELLSAFDAVQKSCEDGFKLAQQQRAVLSVQVTTLRSVVSQAEASALE